jgi:hypothetical protein
MNTAMMDFAVEKAGGPDGLRAVYFTEKFEELDSKMKSAGNSGILLLRDFLMLHTEGGDLEEFVKKVVVNVEIKMKACAVTGTAAKASEEFAPTVSGVTPKDVPVGTRANPGQNHGTGVTVPKATAVPVGQAKRKYEKSIELIDRIRHIFLYTLPEEGRTSVAIPELMEYLKFPSAERGKTHPRYADDYAKVHRLVHLVYNKEFIRHEGYSPLDGCWVHYSYDMGANLGN